jgi:hypothetical protein
MTYDDLTDEERVWIIQLEDAIKSSGEAEIGKVTEFDIALHAIVAKDKTAKAMHRLRRQKIFKETYNIRDDITVYEAIHIVHRFINAHPGFLLSFGKDTFCRWVVFFSLKSLALRADADDGETLAAFYYIVQAMQPDLDAARFGTVWVGDLCEITRQQIPLTGARALFQDSYPIKVKDFPCLNAPSRFSVVYAMCWPFISRKLRQVMVLDCTADKVRRHFPRNLLRPDLGGTQQPADILELLETNLKKRFANDESFRLE